MFVAIASGQSTDAMLRDTMAKDRSSRDTTGKLITLSAAEHIARGNVYLDSRHFPESREHYSRVIEVYPSDAGMARALMGMGRSLMWERRCDEAIPWFDRASREFPATKDGRESLAFKGACHVRTGKNVEAAAIYEQYTVMYPGGERVDSAYLNIIDALREAGKYDEAAGWVQKTRQRFPSMPTSANAMQALVRMEIYRGRWNEAIAAADAAVMNGAFAGSMTSSDEVRFLRAFAYERAGRHAEAVAAYSSIPDNTLSYYSGLAAEKLAAGGSRVKRTVLITPKIVQDFPAPFRSELLRYAKPKNVDPRFVFAIMKQESGFRPNAKSPAAARGLLQLVFDTATRYNKKAGFAQIKPDDLYDPSVNIAIGIEYIADLKGQFGGLYEAIAASYNGGEDNALRWLDRTKPREPGIFASEVGFAETKNYVMKVMANYRVYRELYDENLNRR
jgi:soluble lytic murein transglycosylase